MLIDTFPEFMKYWREFMSADDDGRLELWLEYMSAYPELIEKQKANYEHAEYSWEEVAKTRIFPILVDHIAEIRRAARLIHEIASDVVDSARRILEMQYDPTIVNYVGIGCGAGWATEYGGKPAILLGLENIADCGWTNESSLKGLIAHEAGHLFHDELRARATLGTSSGPLWQLYREGFAQRCEHLISGESTWHMSTGINDETWLTWCEENLPYLASEFLASIDSEEKTRRFFGHWYDLQGKKQCGYYLGHEIVTELEEKEPLRSIAIVPEPEERITEILRIMANNENHHPRNRPGVQADGLLQ